MISQETAVYALINHVEITEVNSSLKKAEKNFKCRKAISKEVKLLFINLLAPSDSRIYTCESFSFGREAHVLLVPWPEIEPLSPAVEAQRLNHWTTREVHNKMKRKAEKKTHTWKRNRRGRTGNCLVWEWGAAGASTHCLQSPPALEPQAAAVTAEVSQKPEATNPDPPLRSYRAKGRELQITVMPPVCFLCRELCVRAQSLSHVRLFETLWTIAHQTPLSMGFSSQEYWSGLPFPFSRGSSWPRDRTWLSPVCPALQTDSLPLSHLGSPENFRSTYSSLIDLWGKYPTVSRNRQGSRSSAKWNDLLRTRDGNSGLSPH